MERYADRGDHVVTCATEHEAVLNACRRLEATGRRVTYLPVDSDAEIDLGRLDEAITDKTVMVSLMTANNEVGTVHDVEAIGRVARRRGVLFHTDAAQAVGNVPVDVNRCNVNLLSMSAHKMYGPKGAGALYARGVGPRVRPNPLVHGGGQEGGIRPGTLNVPAIVGFGKAAQIAAASVGDHSPRMCKQTEAMREILEDAGGEINGNPARRLAHNLSVFFDGVDGKAVINSASSRVAISAGSACTTQTVEPSHVLLAMGYGEDRAHSSIRIGTGRFTTNDDAESGAAYIADAVKRIRRTMSYTPNALTGVQGNGRSSGPRSMGVGLNE